MQLWTFLHIFTMFLALTVIVGGALLATTVIRRRVIDGMRTYFRLAPRIDSVGAILFVAGIVFGVINAIVGGWDLLSGWLIVAYVLVIAAVLSGAVMTPYLKRVKAALDANEGDEPGAELQALLAAPNALLGAAALLVIIGLIIWDMVFKPTF